MKKLKDPFSNYERLTDYISDIHKTVNDLVNSQQEAIEKLEEKTSGFVKIDKVGNSTAVTIDGGGTYDLSKLKPADDKPGSRNYKLVTANRPDRFFREVGDTHRTVTLRIPKGKRIGEAITSIRRGVGTSDFYLWLCEAPDTDLQKALDEVQPNE